MRRLDSFYSQLLAVGFVVLRQAVDSDDRAWVNAELELLHNIPSLLAEENIERHRYFWFKERTHYIQWVHDARNESAKSRMRTFYEPIWSEMESTVLELTESNE